MKLTRILICDDSRDDLEYVSHIIENYYDSFSEKMVEAPYAVSKFSDPYEAISYLDNNAIDIVILDIMMPKMNGIELAFQLRKMNFSGYLIFLSSFNDFAEQSYAVKAFSYMVKPVDPQKIYELLRDIETRRKTIDRNGFALTSRSGIRFISYAEFMYVEVIRHHLHFHLKDGGVPSVYSSLKAYSDILLREPQMIKVQRSFIVNLDYVNSCENSAVFMRDGTRISVPKDFESVREKWLRRMFDEAD